MEFFCCWWALGCVESGRPAASLWLAAAVGGRARVNAWGVESVFPTCPSRLRREGARGSRRAGRPRARPAGGGLRASGGRSVARAGRLAGGRVGGARVSSGPGVGAARRTAAAGAPHRARGRAWRRRPDRPAPRGPARGLQCSLESNRLSRRDVSVPPPRSVPPLPSAGLPFSLRPPLLRVPGRSQPRSVVIVTSQRDGPGRNLLLLLRDVKSRAEVPPRRGCRGRRERSRGGHGGAGLRPGGGRVGGGGRGPRCLPPSR